MTRWLQAIAFAVVLAAGSMGSAMAAEIFFGDLSPDGGTGGCSFTAGDHGIVCNNPLAFTTASGTFTGTGFSDTFDTESAITLKPTAGSPVLGDFVGLNANTLGEGGLGENATGPGTGCTPNVDCEINETRATAVVATGTLINDAVIGSVQAGESFNFFTGDSIAGLTQLGGTITGGTASCVAFEGNADTCFLQFSGVAAIGVVGVNDDVLITAVSTPEGVPEPGTLALLGAGLVGIAVAARRRRSQ